MRVRVRRFQMPAALMLTAPAMAQRHRAAPALTLRRRATRCTDRWTSGQRCAGAVVNDGILADLKDRAIAHGAPDGNLLRGHRPLRGSELGPLTQGKSPRLWCLVWLKLASQSLRFGNLLCRHLLLDQEKIGLGILDALMPSKAEPFMRCHVVFGHTLPLNITSAEVVLSRGIALLGGLAIPLRAFDCVSGHALALEVASAEIVLGHRKALLGGSAIPLDGFNHVLGHTLALVIATGKAELGLSRAHSRVLGSGGVN